MEVFCLWELSLQHKRVIIVVENGLCFRLVIHAFSLMNDCSGFGSERCNLLFAKARVQTSQFGRRVVSLAINSHCGSRKKNTSLDLKGKGRE